MTRELYMYTFKSHDQDGPVKESFINVTEDYPEGFSVKDAREHLANFLSQSNESYVDKWGMVHETYEGKDQVFAYMFEVQDDDWTEVTGETGYWLDDENNGDMPEFVRQSFEKVYNMAMGMDELQSRYEAGNNTPRREISQAEKDIMYKVALQDSLASTDSQKGLGE